MINTTTRWIFLHLGIWRLLRFIERRTSGPGITILYGHRVMADDIIANLDDPRSIIGHTSISEVTYAIKMLSKYYQFISIDQAVEQLLTGKIEKESVVLTFDDGFRDNFTNLLPVLKEFNIPATFYVNSSVIGTKKNLWFQAIINYFFQVNEREVYVESNQKNYDLGTAKKRYSAAFDFMQYLQTNKKPAEFLNVIEESFGVQSLPNESDYHMTWSDLEELSREPLITIGAHSENHYPLGYCDESLSYTEINNSIDELQQKLAIKIEHFSYPRGHQEDFTDLHIALLRKAGIMSATTTVRGVNRTGEDLFRIKRVGFPQSISKDPDEFLWYVAGIPQLVEKFKKMIGR